MNQQPIIILGMHRSGTTMITKILENLGLFVGDKKEVNQEALFFWEINNWIFDLHTAKPELPHNLQYTNPKTEQIIIESLQYFVQSNRKKKYLGNLDKKYKTILELDFPFGWKDPKNTFTLQFWKKIFPNHKIIHVYRNPLDSISSYIERDLQMKNNFEWNWKKKFKRAFLITHKFNYNFRLYNVEQGYQLWKEYVGKAISLKKTHENYFEIQYEAFLENPMPILNELCAFCNLNPDAEAITNEIKSIRKDRAYAFIENEEYYNFYKTIKEDDLIQTLGYQNL
jgi:hypothetical protein